MMPGYKSLNPHELAHRWVKDFEPRPDMSIKVKRKLRDMRIAGRIVRVRSTKQSVGIKMPYNYIDAIVGQKVANVLN